jgi:hypothetical protein
MKTVGNGSGLRRHQVGIGPGMRTSGPGIELVADPLGRVTDLAGLHSDISVHDGVGPGMDRLENNPSPRQQKKQDPH